MSRNPFLCEYEGQQIITHVGSIPNVYFTWLYHMIKFCWWASGSIRVIGQWFDIMFGLQFYRQCRTLCCCFNLILIIVWFGKLVIVCMFDKLVSKTCTKFRITTHYSHIWIKSKTWTQAPKFWVVLFPAFRTIWIKINASSIQHHWLSHTHNANDKRSSIHELHAPYLYPVIILI